MADLIDRQAFVKAMYHKAFETDGDTMWQSGCWVRYRAIEQVVKEQPSADAVEVVRCKDCKWSKPFTIFGRDGLMCERRKFVERFVVENDDFCSRGERRDG